MPAINMQVRDGNNISSFNLHRVNQTLATNAQLLPRVNQVYIAKNYFESNKKLIIIYAFAIFMAIVIIAQYSRKVKKIEGYLIMQILEKTTDAIQYSTGTIQYLIAMGKK